MITAVVDLREHPNWDPSRLAASEFTWPSPPYASLVTLGDIAQTLVPLTWAEAGAAVVTPTSLDPYTGGIRRRSRRYRGSAYQVGGTGNLEVGDLLVPPNPQVPVLFVGPHLVGTVIASRFTALRMDRHLALWTWAVLNSETGRRYRSIMGTEASGWGAVSTNRRVLEFEVPVPPLADLNEAARDFAIVEVGTHNQEEEGADSWWRVVDLRGADWNVLLSTPIPEVLRSGTPLGEFCREIVLGRFNPRNAAALGDDFPSALPVTDIRALTGQPVRLYAVVMSNDTVALPGDVLLAQHGERAYARVVEDSTVPARHVCVLRLRDPQLGPAITRYLNSQAGLGIRRILSTGVTIPNLSRSALERFPVPAESLYLERAQEADVPLTQRLERLLWR